MRNAAMIPIILCKNQYKKVSKKLLKLQVCNFLDSFILKILLQPQKIRNAFGSETKHKC